MVLMLLMRQCYTATNESNMDHERLKELSVFRTQAISFGLPRDVFLPLAALAVGESLILGWWVGILLFVVIYPALYVAHERDPQAAVVWRDALIARAPVIDPALIKTLHYTIR